MLNYFPKYFSNRAIQLYLIGLVACFLVYFQYSMVWFFYLTGIIAVVGFFYFSNFLTIKWKNISEKLFTKKLITTALILRLVWVIFSYFYYISQTGTPFDWGGGDALGYESSAIDIASHLRAGNFNIFQIYLDIMGPSDTGYLSYLGVVYFLTGNSIFIARVLKAIYSVLTCLMIYKLTKRNFGESTGRIAGILAMLMPHFIYYCGSHLKETEMVFLTVAFVERADYVLRNRKFNFLNVAVPILLATSLFFFRTVLGATALMAFFTTIVFSSTKTVGWGKRFLVGIWIIVAVGYFMGGKIAAEFEQTWENREGHAETGIEFRATRAGGNAFAKYAGRTVIAPMIFTIPFPTMIKIDFQPVQQMLNGTNFVKNITSFFTMLGIFLLFYRKKWREHILILSFLIGYLFIIANSGFAQSERFHLPSVPFAIIIAAYSISQMDNKKKKYFNAFLFIIFAAIMVWNWYKLAGRGMI